MSRSRKLNATVGIAALVAAVPAASYAVAHARTAGTTHGTLHVWVTPGKGAVDKILLTGVIGDYGTATSETKSGKVTENGNYAAIALKHGTFKVNSVAFNKKADQTTPHVDKKTCTAWASLGGKVTLFDGTGSYAGISGKIHITTSFAEVGPRFTSGPKKGECNLSESAKPLASFNGQITGSGPVTF